MTSRLQLRRATLRDAPLLLEWRNDPATRQASHCTDPVPLAEHLAWLARTLADPARELYIAEWDRLPIGSLRVDFADGVHLVSWTVAPAARRRGLGTLMLVALLARIAGEVSALIKVGNIASVRVAERAGLELRGRTGDVLRYGRPARTGARATIHMLDESR